LFVKFSANHVMDPRPTGKPGFHFCCNPWVTGAIQNVIGHTCYRAVQKIVLIMGTRECYCMACNQWYFSTWIWFSYSFYIVFQNLI